MQKKKNIGATGDVKDAVGITKKPLMYLNGYIKLCGSSVSMNNTEYEAFSMWMNHAGYSIKGRRFYEGAAPFESDEDTAFRRNASMSFPNWFKLKCIARRIYEHDRERGIVHHNEWITWLPTKAKGYHVVITSTGRVFHVICNRSRWGLDRRREGREVVELKVDKWYRVRVGDCYKQCKSQTSKVKDFFKAVVGEKRSWKVAVWVKPSLIECFGRDMLAKTLPKGMRDDVLSYGSTDAMAAAGRVDIVMQDEEGGMQWHFKCIKEAAAHFGMKYNSFKSKLNRAGSGGRVKLGATVYIFKKGDGRGKGVNLGKGFRVVRGKCRGFNLQRRIGASIKASKSFKTYMFRKALRERYGFLFGIYQRWRERAMHGVLSASEHETIEREVAVWLGDDSPRLAELSDSIYEDANRIAKVKMMRKRWGRADRKRRQREYMSDPKNRDAWALKCATKAMEALLSGTS